MKKNYPAIKLAVPSNINYKTLFESLEGLNETEKKNKRDSVYLFLSFLVPTQWYNNKYESNKYFKPINSKLFNKITRNQLMSVKKILMSDNIPIILENSSYQNGKKNKSFKLREEYFHPDIKFITIQSKISENYLKFKEDKNREKEILKSQYPFLFNQYDSRISISDEAEKFVDQLEKQFLSNAYEQLFCENSKTILNNITGMKIKFMRQNIKNIKEGKFDPSVSVTNHRLNSVITQMKKELRSYLLINNNPIAEIDISGSHLYVLASILNEEFFTSTSNKFSLYNIYNELYHDINNSIYIINKNKKFSPIPFMCGDLEKEIKTFKSLFDGNDIYENINHLVFKGKKTRDEIKDGIMNFLNQSQYRKSSKFISDMKKNFPNINGLIEKIQRINQHKSYFALLLQRVESYLLLQVGAKELLNQIPDLCFFTIHDAVVVEKSKAKEVKAILEIAISEKTGVKIQFKVKLPNKDM